jgi:mono/diheme cytochrome c family protein
MLCNGPFGFCFIFFKKCQLKTSTIMRSNLWTVGSVIVLSVLVFSQCTEDSTKLKSSSTKALQPNYGGFESMEQWGEHLVTIGACHDCHSPKKFTANGMELDSSRLLSGHQAQSPMLPADRKELESKGLVLTGDLTTWIGPWGVSYTANLTSDPTGIGNWTEAQFFKAIREGKYKGMDNTRSLLPPMPWPMYKNMTDDELKAIFAYLKSTVPVKNVVPPPQPPVSASHQ